ncbi:MAG TPA: wax ester/triacylglycerol synthase domain-containing protein [Aliidongia sp.]|nr:wax ester/triacylglycerol synthase domain-containing protein [Aliidongia sp.]
MLDHSYAPRKLRNLDGLEKALWLLNYNRNTHFSVVAEIEGLSTAEPLRAAAESVGKQIPFVSARIVVDTDGTPFFEIGEPRAIPLKVVEAGGRHWTQYLEDELADRFDAMADPLLRLRLVIDGGKCALILSMHHSVADGRSAVYLLRDILSSASGRQVVPAIDIRSLEQALDDKKLPVREIPPLREALNPSPGYRAADLKQPSVAARTIDPGHVAALRERARQERTTVHGALCAAAARAFARTKPAHPVNPPRVLSPVDARRRLLDAAENLAFYVNGITVDLPKFDENFWEDARRYSAKVDLFNDPHVLAYGIRGVRAAAEQASSVEIAAALWAKIFGAEVLVTNLGNLDIPVTYGSLHLTGLWGPAISMGIAGEESIGAATLDGRLHLLHLSFQPPIGFLDAVVDILNEACGLS